MARSSSQQDIIRFGQFELDLVNRELRKRGMAVKLQPQQFAVLLMLATRAGQLVSRDEIHQNIWGTHTFVDFERSINFSINQIRSALGDDAENPRFIETLPRRGYRFIASIENEKTVEAVSAASLTLPSSSDRRETASVSQESLDLCPKSHDLSTPRSAGISAPQRLLIVCLIAFISAGAAVFVSRVWHSRPRIAQANISANVRTFPLTAVHGTIWDYGVAFSPDAHQVAFVWDGPNLKRPEIYVQLIGGGDRPLQITHSQSAGVSFPIDWSPDGRLLAFGRCGDDNRGALYTISALGGPERKVTDVTCLYGNTGARWTPDGQSIVFADSCTPAGPVGIAVYMPATGSRRCLAVPDSTKLGLMYPEVSPDGSTVAYVDASTVGVGDVYTVSFAGGPPRRITFEGITACPLRWSIDGQYIVFQSDRAGSGGNQLWRVSAKGGPIEPETVSLHPGISSHDTVSHDGVRLAYVDGAGEGAIWRAQLSSPGGKLFSQKKIIFGSNLFDKAPPISPQLSPDGKQLAFVGISSNIWTSDVDGANPLQVTALVGGFSGTPRWSPDGKQIVFDHRTNDHAVIYVIDAEGRNLRAITDGKNDDNVPTWSRDGKAIFFSSHRTGRWEMWKHDLGSGVEVQLTQHGGFSAFESYDGQYLYYTKFYGRGIWRMPLGGGEEQRITNQPRSPHWGDWDVTEAGLYFLDADASPRPVIAFYDFKSRGITESFQLEEQLAGYHPGIGASRDGRNVVFEQGDGNSTIMIVENSQ